MSKKNNKNVDITNAFLNNWHPDNFEKKYIYIRDAKVNCLLCCFSRKGMHSWAYDYVKKGTHKSKVFGYYPAISIKQARKKALEIQIQVVDEDKDYDEVFEIHRHPSYIYFLENKSGQIKIGKSTNWIARIKELTISTEDVRLIGIRLESKVFNEQTCHQLYRKYRQQSNEWFNDKSNEIKKLITAAVVYGEKDHILSSIMIEQHKNIYN
jgi:hypothetical protein|tara:strand:- start:7489 stop:8118 length:630 start_codon:yes stop_codon:yes gene_type:complete